MNRIDAKFRELKARGKKALIIYLTCGYPDLNTTGKLVLEAQKRGADIIELGMPFSDPLADGPVIQEASEQALKRKSALRDIFALVRRIRKTSQIPLCLMGYYNPILSFGRERFVNEARKAGVDGVIIPDLPPEEDRELVSLAKTANFKTIFFLSPTSSIERIKYISRVSTGFIYYVSLTGVTGERRGLSVDLRRNIETIKKYTLKPLCVGFGISRKEHVQEVFKAADGAIVGSAVIKVIKDNIGKKGLVEKTGKFIEGLRCIKNPH